MTKSSFSFGQLNSEAKAIFSLVQKNGALTKSSLVELTKTKLTTLNRIMEPLETQRYLVECGIGESTGGRKPSLFSVNSERYCVIGIDISRTYSQVVITGLDIKIRFKKLFSMDESYTPQKTIDTITELINEGLESLGILKENVLGLGVGTVGPLDRLDGKLINPANFLAEGWENVPLKAIFEEKLEIPTFVDNGANTSVLAEYLFDKISINENIAYFNCGIGIRTGAISSGIIVRTINDREDVFAHMVVDVDGEACTCGNYGCIECYCAIPSLMRKFISYIKKGRSSKVNIPLEQITYLDVCHAASEGDELSREVIISAATIFGAGLANYINLLNPGLVVLSGPLISSSDLFYKVCTETAYKKYYTVSEHVVKFSQGGYFGDNAISVGAAAMVIEKLIGSRLIG